MSKLKIVTFPSLAYYKRFNLGEKIMQKKKKSDFALF